MTQDYVLPIEFRDLEPFAEEWNVVGLNARFQRRKSLSMERIRKFYDTAVPRMEAILAYLEKFELYALPEPEKRLFRVLCGLCEISVSVELLKRPYLEVPGGAEPIYLRDLPIL